MKRKAELISKNTIANHTPLCVTNPCNILPDSNAMDVQQDEPKLNTTVFFSSIAQHKTTNGGSYSIPISRK